MVIADFMKEQEMQWKPVLESRGFYDFQLQGGEMDLKQAIDATAKHPTTGDDVLRIALRTRNVEKYSPAQLREYKRQFTIRRSRPTGALTEWDKIFGENRTPENSPRLTAYGWVGVGQDKIEDYVVLSVKVLRDLYQNGQLESCIVGYVRNTDRRGSKLVAISLPCVQECSDNAAVVYHSPNHPGLTKP